MIFFNCQRNFRCPNIFRSATKVPDLLQAGIPRDGPQCTEHLQYMGTTCGGAVVLNALEEFGLFEADEKSVSGKCLEAKCREKPGTWNPASNQRHGCWSFDVDRHCNTFKNQFWTVYTQAYGGAGAIAPEHAAAIRGHHRFFFWSEKKGCSSAPSEPPWLRAWRYNFLQPSANSFGALCVVKEDGEIEHLPPSRSPLDRPTGTCDQQANDDSYHSPYGAAPEVSAI